VPKVQVSTTNFSAGEFSPELEGRADIEKFNSSVKLAKNVVVLKQGGATGRPAMQFLGAVKDNNYSTRVVPFIYNRSDSYILEFGNLYMRVWKNGARVGSYELTTPLTALEVANMDFSQGGDSMIITVGTRHPQRLRRFADDQWEISDAPFVPPALGEIGERPAVALTLSASTIGAGRTATAASAAFLASDVGRTISSGVGTALITAYTDTQNVTITIQTAFPSTSLASEAWVIGESPMTTLTPSADSPVGAACTLTLSAAGWRAGDASGYVEVNGGLVKVTQFTSDTVLQGTIVRELTSVTGAVGDSWALLLPLWNAFDGYPETCTFYQQRLWFGNTARYPQSIWGSRSALYFDFTPGTLDDSAVYKSAASDEINPIQFLCSGKSLVMLGYGAEFEGKGGIEKPVTQLNMQINVESEWGAAAVRPVTVGKEIIFAERTATALRSLFPAQVDGYESMDVSVYSEHLLRAGVKFITFEKRPYSVLWVGTNDGKLHAFTYNREQNTLAWCSGETDGEVEWGATVPEGAGDRTYISVRRVVGSNYVRFIERLNWDIERGRFDSMIESTGGGNVWACAHLIGRTVDVVADGVYLGPHVVNGAGNVVLSRDASTVARGLPVESKLTLRAPEVGTGSGTSQGQAQSTNRVWVRLLRSVGLKVNGTAVPFRRLGASVLDQQVAEFTGLKEITTGGWAKGESDLDLVQDQGMPWTVLAVIRSFTVNSG
jgi:hypothetical protein